MVSSQVIPVLGLDLTVYGLAEYKLLPEINTPVSIIFVLYGRGHYKSTMNSLTETLCQLNEKRNPNQCYLLVVAFDSINHGSRYVHKVANYIWTGEKRENPNFPIDMWNITNSNTTTVSQLIDVLECYLFAPRDKSIVQTWGIVGYSLGGHSSFIIAAEDPRITVAISMNGTFDFCSLMQHLHNVYKIPKENHPPQSYWDVLIRKRQKILSNVNSTHFLILNGENDDIVPYTLNERFIQNLRKVHTGIEGYDWEACIVPKSGHEWPNSAMIKHSVNWVYQWMIKMTSESKL